MNIHFAHNSIFIEKFIHNQERFIPESNNFYYIKEDSNLNYNVSTAVVSRRNVCLYFSIKTLIKNLKVNQEDRLYFHFFSIENQKLCLKFSKNISYWLFWGGEVYGLPYIKNDIFLPITLNFKKIGEKQTFKNVINQSLGLLIRCKLNVGLPKAVKHINYFCHFVHEEFDRLKEILPLYKAVYLDWNYLVFESELGPSNGSKNLTLLGQSATLSNNHLDVLSMYRNELENEQVIIPLSYPINEKYVEEIENFMIEKKLNHQILKEKIPFSDYNKILNNVKFAIFGFKRNQGTGNIIQLLISGALVFLHHDNPFYNYLKSIGVDVYQLNEFKNRLTLEVDIDKNKMTMNKIFGPEALKIKYNRLLN